jgi:Rrf2 family protein
MLVDMAMRYNQGPVQVGEIARRQDISVKYLEQLIIPLKKAGYVKSVRGPKGGHMLAKPPEEITVGEIVYLLEGGIELTDCIISPTECPRSRKCPTRSIWEEATKAMYEKLNTITLADIMEHCDQIPLDEEEPQAESAG